MEIPFTKYLHDNFDSAHDAYDRLKEEHDITLTHEAFQEFKYAFYEIKFNCMLDTETGEVTILSVE